MSSHSQVSTSTGVDGSAERLGIKFSTPGSGGSTNSWIAKTAWYCEDVTIRTGPKPSHAKVVVPCNSDDEAANIIAFDPTGPAKEIKIGSYCAISKLWTSTAGAEMSALVFVGKVQLIEFDRDNDQLIVDVVDARADLREIYIVGRWVHVPVDDEGHAGATSYQQGWPAHFNPGGRPNCIFDGETGRPEFAPYPDYGLSGNQTPDMSAADFSRASYWTLGRILTYLRNHYSAAATIVAQWPGLPKAPSWLVWPEGLGNAIDQEDVQNFNSGLGQGTQNAGGSRKGREVILEGYGLLESLDLLLSIAGGHSLAITPRGYQNILGVVKTRYTGGGVSIPYAASGTPTAAAAITGGTFIEDGEDFITSILGRSQLCFVERRFTTYADPEDPQPGDSSLKAAWTTARETEFKTKIIELGNDAEAYREACTLFPEVYTTWVVNPQYDFLADTPWSGYPRAALARTPWPTQHSYMTDEIGSRDYAGLRWPIYVEILTDEDEETWVRGPLFDGLEIFDTGVIYLPALRDLNAEIKCFAGIDGASSTVPFTEDEDGTASIAIRDIRMNLAIPCDHGVSWTVSAPITDFGGGTEIETYGGNPDQNRIATTHARAKFVDLQQLYAAIYRVGSYYKPESCGGTASANEYVRNDLTLLQAHVRRLMYEENRLRKGGAPRFDGHLVTAYQPGQAVKDFTASGKKPFPVHAQLTGLRLRSSGGDQPATSTELLFGD